MTQVYFHCSNTKKVFVDYCGAVVDDLAEARDHATRVVESFTCERSLDDWRDWVLHVSDDRGDELFIVPFTFVLGVECDALLRQRASFSTSATLGRFSAILG